MLIVLTVFVKFASILNFKIKSHKVFLNNYSSFANEPQR